MKFVKLLCDALAIFISPFSTSSLSLGKNVIYCFTYFKEKLFLCWPKFSIIRKIFYLQITFTFLRIFIHYFLCFWAKKIILFCVIFIVFVDYSGSLKLFWNFWLQTVLLLYRIIFLFKRINYSKVCWKICKNVSNKFGQFDILDSR